MRNQLREEVLRKVDVEEILRKCGVEVLRKDGAWLTARCPLHEDQRPSFRCASEDVGDHEKGFWICHAKCGSGALFDLPIKLDLAKDFLEACAFMDPGGAKGRPGPDPKPREIHKQRREPIPPKEVEDAQEALRRNADAMRYLTEERGITKKFVETLRMGLRLERHGLQIVLPKPALGVVDHFKILPFPRPERASKALRFWVTEGADSSILYPGEDFGEQPELLVVVVESELDAALLLSMGIHAVAVGGTSHFTYAMLEPLLERDYIPLLLPDGDKPGQAALRKCSQKLIEAREEFATTPEPYPSGCKDLGDIVKEKGREEAEAWIRGAIQKAERLSPRPGSEDVWSKLETSVDERGNPVVRRLLSNLDIMLDNDPRWAGRMWFNEMGGSWMIDNELFTDEDISNMRVELQDDYGIDWGSDTMHERVRAACRRRSRSPAREYLRALRWDGKERLSYMLGDYFTAGKSQDLPLKGLYLRKFMISAVARALQPGCKADSMLVLYSKKQGIGKSRFCAALAGPWFCDESIRPDDKDVKLALHKAWIVEVSELDATTKRRDLAELRAFLSRTEDTIRAAYARFMVVHKRGFVFLGTTNDQGVVREADGRRYWPIEVLDVDVDSVARDRDQLFAEAVAAYDANEPWWLDSDSEASRRADTEAHFTADDAAKDVVTEFCSYRHGPDGVSVAEVSGHLRDKGLAVGRHEVGAILRTLGFEKKVVWLPINQPRDTQTCAKRWVFPG